MLFRQAQEADLDAIDHLAQGSGVGMTTLPKDHHLLEKRLSWSCASFKRSIHTPKHEYYLFVLEDQSTGHVVGISAIESVVGYDAPFYSYKLSTRSRRSRALHIRNDYEILTLVNDYQGNSEICTLFLDPNYRYNSNGLLLSRARFLFMANNPSRVNPTIIAEMRGFSDEQGRSPFWEHVGAHFFQMPFSEADRLTLLTNKQFIADLMPRHPLYVNLLPKEAQEVIGQAHPSTCPAMNILLKEGFRYTHYVDIFDAGPTIEVPRDQIATIRNSTLVTITSLTPHIINSKRYLISNTERSFRATVGWVICDDTEKTCQLDPNTAACINVSCGDVIRISIL